MNQELRLLRRLDRSARLEKARRLHWTPLQMIRHEQAQEVERGVLRTIAQWAAELERIEGELRARR